MKIDIIYATITGNNELLAKAIAQEFKKHDQKAVIHEFEDTDVDDFNDSDIVVIVCYTYDNGSIPDESLDFYDDLEDTDWSGKICGVAGSGDEFYGRDFCVAVDSYSEQVKKNRCKYACRCCQNSTSCR